jgi:hypothetical protein
MRAMHVPVFKGEGQLVYEQRPVPHPGQPGDALIKIEAWHSLRPFMTNSLMMVIPATIILSFIGAVKRSSGARSSRRGKSSRFLRSTSNVV